MKLSLGPEIVTQILIRQLFTVVNWAWAAYGGPCGRLSRALGKSFRRASMPFGGRKSRFIRLKAAAPLWSTALWR